MEGIKGYGALVTGGGTGIGHACAARLAADGARVLICGRTEAKLVDSAAAANKTAAHGGRVEWMVTDVTDEAQVKATLDRAQVLADGRLDIVVANAGGGGLPSPYHLQDTEEFLRVLNLNLLGTFFCVKHSVPLLFERGGSFIGMSSIAGHLTHIMFGAYPVAKAGIEQMMRNAADEYGSRRIRFNAIRPGFIATEMMDIIPRDSAVYESYLRNTPLADVGQPGDVAELARFLAGPESRWITGQCINVDGGHSLRAGPDFSHFLRPHLSEDVLAGRLP